MIMRFPTIRRFFFGFICVILAFPCVTGRARAETNLLFILDASGSMWGQIEGVAKIQTAKDVLADLLADLPPDTRVGFMAYGHNEEGACDDIELISGIGTESTAALIKKIRAITPKGKTPIAGALAASATAFSDPNANNNVVLISDGVETCNGDPCAEAKKLAAMGISTKVHVIGFDLGAEERAQLQCIADNGGGRYLQANSAEELKEAVAEVQVAAQETAPPKQPEPEPTKEPEVYFFDDFDGEVLAEHWEVANPDEESYIVEDGSLLVIAQAVGGLADPNIPNIFKLLKPLPKGDWTVTIELTAELQTGRDLLEFGLYDDPSSFVLTRLWGQNDVCCYSSGLFLEILKRARGENTQFTNKVLGGTNDYQTFAAGVPQPITVKLVKEGRTYHSMANLAGDRDNAGEPRWVETDVVTALRAPKELVINMSQWDKVTGESLFMIDSVKIESQ
jgi:Ca-activated chloride channel family protein